MIEVLDLQTFGLDCVDAQKLIRSSNQFARDVDENGEAVWTVEWTQTVTLAAQDFNSLDDFLAAHVAWNLAASGDPDPGNPDDANDIVVLPPTP